jgi:hypothetical protein
MRTARRCSSGRPVKAIRTPVRLVGQHALRLRVRPAVRAKPNQELGVHGHLPAHPERVHGHVPGDRQEPRDDSPPARIERARVPPGPEEGLLGYLFGHARVPHDGHGEAVDAALESPYERGRAVRVTRGQTGEQGLIGERPHRKTYGWGPRMDCPDVSTRRSGWPTGEMTEARIRRSVQRHWTLATETGSAKPFSLTSRASDTADPSTVASVSSLTRISPPSARAAIRAALWTSPPP